MGVLAALGALPAVLLGLLAGVWVDRSRRRRLMIAADLARAVLRFTIPLAALFGVLRVEHLYLVVLLVASGTLFFNVANSAYFPTLVGRELLVDGNRRLSLSGSLAEILGPGLAGALVQIVTAPIAIAVDAISYVVSALFLAWMNTPEAAPRPPAAQSNLRHELGEGLRLIAGHSVLRAIAGSLCTVNLFNAAFEAVALDAHELIKVKFNDLKDQKREIAQELADQMHAELIYVLGNTAILYRQQPDAEKRKIHLPPS